MTQDYHTGIDLCDGKYTVIYNPKTGQSECLRYGEKWRDLRDKMVLAMFDEIVELRAKLEETSDCLLYERNRLNLANDLLEAAKEKLVELKNQEPVAFEVREGLSTKGILTRTRPSDEECSEHELTVYKLYIKPIPAAPKLEGKV